ncbi:Uncharacterised protein [Mycobacteroides abscessus subsp. abscessus]|nr:Uncharacterised protein [Mycobacteroides abscessus subsp. abscessus]
MCGRGPQPACGDDRRLIKITDAAERRGQHHRRLDLVPYRRYVLRQLFGRVRIPQCALAVTGHHGQLGVHPGQPQRQTPRPAGITAPGQRLGLFQ